MEDQATLYQQHGLDVGEAQVEKWDSVIVLRHLSGWR
jgi:hypothetical protein